MKLSREDRGAGGAVMDALDDEIALFWSKSLEEITKELAEANLDPQPAVEAVMKLMREKGVSPLK
jgi:hypothetical protein